MTSPLSHLEYWDWRLDRLDPLIGTDGSKPWTPNTLTIIADYDLSYHHSVEVVFKDVGYIECPTEFSHPKFRDAIPSDRERIGNAGGYGRMIVAWEIEGNFGGTVLCLIAAHEVVIREGLVMHPPWDKQG